MNFAFQIPMPELNLVTISLVSYLATHDCSDVVIVLNFHKIEFHALKYCTSFAEPQLQLCCQ